MKDDRPRLHSLRHSRRDHRHQGRDAFDSWDWERAQGKQRNLGISQDEAFQRVGEGATLELGRIGKLAAPDGREMPCSSLDMSAQRKPNRALLARPGNPSGDVVQVLEFPHWYPQYQCFR